MRNIEERVKDKKTMRSLEKRCGGNYLKVLERDSFKCAKCGMEHSIVVHHIDSNVKNNEPNNLITLCKQCHAIEHGYNLSFNKPRVGIILELRSQYKTFQEIGDYLGISRQRVHQIARLFNPLDKKVLKEYHHDMNDMTNELLFPRAKCIRCLHEWNLRTAKPVACPKCHSPFWDRERQSEIRNKLRNKLRKAGPDVERTRSD